MNRLHRTYKRTKNQLINVLERKKNEIQTFYNNLILTNNIYKKNQNRK